MGQGHLSPLLHHPRSRQDLGQLLRCMDTVEQCMPTNTTPNATHNPVVDAPELQPGSIAHRLHMAWMLQLELVGCRRSLTATKRPMHPNTSQRFLDLMATAGAEVFLDSKRDRDMVPVICIPSHSQSSLHQLPPPFLARFQGKNPWKMVWKAPSFPWSSLLQQWVMVDWFANEPGYLVLGLRAAGSTGAHGHTSLHTPQAQTASPWPPPFQHQGVQDAQLAATARQMPVTACGAATPPVATPAPPCGPGPKEGRQDCSGVQCQANVGPERDHIHQEHCTSTPLQQPRPVSDGRQGVLIGAACPHVAPTAAQPGPGTNRERLMKAIQLQRQLLSDRLAPPGGVAPVHSTTSHTILRMMATATSVVDLNSMWDQSAVPVICMPCGGQSSLPELPPPFLVRILGNNHWEMLLKDPSFPWSSLLQLWEMVVWSTEAPGGHLVLWLRVAASTGSPAHGPTSLHTPQALTASPRPPLYTPHQQGQGAQLAATARQMPDLPCGAATPPVPTPAPPCGPGPKDGCQDCSVQASAIMQAQLACPSGAEPGTQVVAADINAAAPVVATGPGADQSTAAAEWQHVDENTIKKWLCNLPNKLKWQLGLHHAPVALQTTVLVQLLVVGPASLNASGTEKAPHLDCVASRNASNHWTLCAKTSLKTSTTVTAWVRRMGMQLTGRYKVAKAWSDQAGARLVLEVRPLPPAARNGEHATPGPGETSRVGAGPSQPAAGSGGVAAEARPGSSQPAAAPAPPAAGPEGRAGPNSGAGFKRNVSDTVQGNTKRQCGSQGHSPSLAAGVAQPAPDQGPEDMEVAPAALPDLSALSGGATAAAGLGTAEEGGPGPSQPAAGMGGALDEDDPEVSQPAAAPAHAVGDLPVTWTRPAPGEGQAIDVIEVIDLTQDEPDIPQGSGAMQPAPESEAPLLAPNLELPGVSTPDQGPEDMEVAPAALTESSAPASGATAAAGLGTAEEGGPGPSQPAAGMGGALDEDDPEVSQPAAAPAHAGVEGAGGCILGASHDGLTSDAAAPPCQATRLAPPDTPYTGSTASPHSQPATLASCPAPCLALGGNSTSSPEPAGGQQDGALSSDAEEVALPLSGAGLAAGPLPLPSWVSDMVNRANEVQLSLQHNPANWDRAPEPRSDDASHYLLSFISQPAPAVDWKEQTIEFVIPVVYVPHDGLPSQHQLPPPFLIRGTQDHQLAVVWKPPDWPWSSVQQHWERVVWTALTKGHMVVGLEAGGNACHEAGVSIWPRCP
ncbi:hypothetical protein V8C86DRAFT_798944 [Haematococcus lacustris]